MKNIVSDILHSYKDNSDNLIKLLTECSQKAPAFTKTLNDLGADTFLIEKEYVDKDYLEDYATFYASCYQPYKRFCQRVHFFKKKGEFSFTNEILMQLLQIGVTDSIIQQIQQSYIGFIVLKPTKDDTTIIGRTCLAHYKEEDKRNRRYNATREYTANLYGIPLSVKSMAFQEQDEAVAVCASIALWSAFSITGKKYQHRIPSPSEVTNLALSETSYISAFPSEGLTPEQMAVAMAKVRLKPLILRPKGHRNLKAQIYAYLRAGIPVVCGISLYNEYKSTNKSPQKIIPNSRSFHAVTINGFSFENGNADIDFRDRLKLISTRMTQFYAHDDQLCPFTKMVFENGYILPNKVKTTWLSDDKKRKPAEQQKLEQYKVADIESLIIPLYHKIRINYNDILSEVQKFAKLLNNAMTYFYKRNNTTFIPFEWDIFLNEVTEFKRDVLSMPSFEKKQDILQCGFAKYLWRAQALAIAKDEQNVNKKEIVMEIVFDATDAKKKGIAKTILFYNKNVEHLFNFFMDNKQKSNE